MIRDVNIRNFKCFKHLRIERIRRINVIVGDNGAGKTALLEALFLALGSTTELIARYRAQRGITGNFHGSAKRVSDAIFTEYFHNFRTDKEISIGVLGDGDESRSVRMYRGANAVARAKGGDPINLSTVQFEWKNARGRTFKVTPEISSEGLNFPDTGEDLPNFSYYAANHTYSSLENAERFSLLSRRDRSTPFIETIRREYPWVEDLSIEVAGGAPALYATVTNLADKIPVTSISGGINRLLTVLLGIAYRQRSVVLVDELENGLFHAHHKAFWRAIIRFSREYESQLFLTTHSLEWLRALISVAGDDTDDMSIWRVERDEEDGWPTLVQHDGRTFKDAIEYGTDLRGP